MGPHVTEDQQAGEPALAEGLLQGSFGFEVDDAGLEEEARDQLELVPPSADDMLESAGEAGGIGATLRLSASSCAMAVRFSTLSSDSVNSFAASRAAPRLSLTASTVISYRKCPRDISMLSPIFTFLDGLAL